ncbi:hypothetical protein [Bacteriovorax sp. Seq25_V]|uniref:hypothetical protein n=1 Tax=Bacteriovorax sp. Seq25_V TaxID=1201288 RepID=UPI00038A2A69|nr:hypothetical protein [Bacteriovorax sp. Seq25_V]EQC43304.1 hypothetical protein M900_0069 [Bacteriovorax sp. Seq25_V]
MKTNFKNGIIVILLTLTCHAGTYCTEENLEIAKSMQDDIWVDYESHINNFNRLCNFKNPNHIEICKVIKRTKGEYISLMEDLPFIIEELVFVGEQFGKILSTCDPGSEIGDVALSRLGGTNNALSGLDETDSIYNQNKKVCESNIEYWMKRCW